MPAAFLHERDMRPKPPLHALTAVLVLLIACDCGFQSPFSAASARASTRSVRASPAPSASSARQQQAGAGPSPVQSAAAVPGSVYGTDWLAKHPSPDLGVHGQAAVLIDVERQQIVWQRDPSTPRAPASLTKIVTAMVAADLAPLDKQVTVSGASDMKAAQSVEPASTVMGLGAGEVLTLRELMYGLFMRSGNDAAETIAGGIVPRDRFMELMNQKAAALGMTRSHFTTPVGLDDPGMYSTAHDLAVAAATIVKRYPELLAISGTPQIAIPQTATHKAYMLENYNKLLLPGPLNYGGATGMKTAFTDNAGPCMVATARRGQRRLVAVTLHSENFFDDANKLLTYGFGLPS
jgi:serine-type D-Ala-D-Ala carboxypeptidase (penicillin-binding protein 5/6)